MESTPRIYVVCLNSYNNGVHHGVWIDCYMGEDHINEEIQKMLSKSKFENSEEYAIHDHENFNCELSEYESIENICKLADLIDEHGEIVGELFNNCYNIEELEEKFENGYGVYNSMYDYGYELINDCYNLDKFLLRYFDFEQYAEDCRLEGSIDVYNVGRKYYVFNN